MPVAGGTNIPDQKEVVSDEYLQNGEITSESQANGTHNMQSSTSDQQKCEKLFDADKSNNFLYSSNNSSQMDSKSAEDVVTECATQIKDSNAFTASSIILAMKSVSHT
jgi:hypothetical protein